MVMIHNSVKMKGSIVDLRTIVHASFDLQTLYPCPHLDALGEPLNDEWVDWCLEHWGTTGVSDITMIYNDDVGTLAVDFLSEVGEPHGFFAYLQSRFPSLVIQTE
jgi:hypothetical protein